MNCTKCDSLLTGIGFNGSYKGVCFSCVLNDYPRLQGEIERLREHEKWLKLGHEAADGFLDMPSQSHIVDKVCIIGHQRDELRAEIERLQGIVGKLPKTADGVFVVPHRDYVWVYIGFKSVKGFVVRRGMKWVAMVQLRNREIRYIPIGNSWSTRKAAEAAGGE